MKSFFLVAGILFSWNSFVFAQITVSDPKNILADLRAEIPQQKFEDFFQCGKSAKYKATAEKCQITCKTTYCMSQCSEANKSFDLHIEDCSSDQVSIYGDNGLSIEVSQAEFNKSGSWLVGLIRASGHYFSPAPSFEIYDLWNHWPVTIISGGQKKEISAMIITVQIVFGPGLQTYPYRIFINPQETGLKQIIGIFDDQDQFMILNGASYVF
jgi:hypothetical protein